MYVDRHSMSFYCRLIAHTYPVYVRSGFLQRHIDSCLAATQFEFIGLLLAGYLEFYRGQG